MNVAVAPDGLPLGVIVGTALVLSLPPTIDHSTVLTPVVLVNASVTVAPAVVVTSGGELLPFIVNAADAIVMSVSSRRYAAGASFLSSALLALSDSTAQAHP